MLGRLAGESTAGESTAGESAAGESAAGESTEIHFRHAAERALRRGLPEAAAWSRLRLGLHLRREGRLRHALVELRLAREIGRRLGDRRLEIRALEAIFSTRTRLGEDLASIEADAAALASDLDQVPDFAPDQRALLHSMVANARFRLGRYAEAEEAWQRAETLLESAGRPQEALVDAFNRSLRWLATEPPDPERARRELEAVLERAEALGEARIEARALQYLGSLASGDAGEALLARSLALARDLEPLERFEAARKLATLLAGYRPEDASRFLDEALALAGTLDDRAAEAYLWEARMRVAWATRPPEDATEASFAVLDDLETLIEHQQAAGGRGELLAVWTEAYDWLAGRLLLEVSEASASASPLDLEALDALPALADSAGSLDGRSWSASDEPASLAVARAFEVLERRRARLLLVALETGRRDVSPEHRRLLDRVVEVNLRLLSPDLDATQRADLVARLDEIERHEAELERRAETERADDLERDASRFEPVDLATARATLAPDEALLVYQVAPWGDAYRRFAGGAWLLVVHRDGASVHAVGDPTSLATAVDLFVGLLPARDGTEVAAAARLGDRLLAPALGSLPPEIDHLLLVPDQALHRLPFEALIHGEAGRGERIGRKYRVSRLPSATVWHRWRSGATPTADAPALVLADPLPAPGREPGARPAMERSWTTRGEALGRLPGAADEGRAIRRRLGRETVLRLDERASEAALYALDPGRFAVLHFAAHAVVDPRHDRRSGVVLAPGGPRDDGLLQPPEIASLDLDGRLVVLSACQSAAGPLLRGEGPLSLARAFHEAGARAVVAGLWRLRDDDTRDVFDAFYAALADGADVATAARAARRDRLDAGAPAHAWAGVVVLGDGAHVPFPLSDAPQSPRSLPVAPALGALTLGTLAALALAFFLLLRRRRSAER